MSFLPRSADRVLPIRRRFYADRQISPIPRRAYDAAMDSMKGPSNVVIACQVTPQTMVNLMRYRDGGWGIIKAGATIGIWEHAELDECFNVFALQVGIRDRHAEQTVVLRVRHVADAALN